MYFIRYGLCCAKPKGPSSSYSLERDCLNGQFLECVAVGSVDSLVSLLQKSNPKAGTLLAVVSQAIHGLYRYLRRAKSFRSAPISLGAG
jgi:hypothetical protein